MEIVCAYFVMYFFLVVILQKAKLEAGKMPPSEMFKSETALYSSFDEKVFQPLAVIYNNVIMS